MCEAGFCCVLGGFRLRLPPALLAGLVRGGKSTSVPGPYVTQEFHSSILVCPFGVNLLKVCVILRGQMPAWPGCDACEHSWSSSATSLPFLLVPVLRNVGQSSLWAPKNASGWIL